MSYYQYIPLSYTQCALLGLQPRILAVVVICDLQRSAVQVGRTSPGVQERVASNMFCHWANYYPTSRPTLWTPNQVLIQDIRRFQFPPRAALVLAKPHFVNLHRNRLHGTQRIPFSRPSLWHNRVDVVLRRQSSSSRDIVGAVYRHRHLPWKNPKPMSVRL